MGGMSSRMTCEDVVKCMKDHKDHEEKKNPSAFGSVLGMGSQPKAPASAPASKIGLELRRVSSNLIGKAKYSGLPSSGEGLNLGYKFRKLEN